MSKEETQNLIGKLLPEGTEKDAIHIAVFPAIAGKDMYPRDDVAYDAEAEVAFPCRKENGAIGIVDPFYVGEDFGQVKKGDRFFIFIYPNTVTGLKHNWEHPAFKVSERKDIMTKHEQWLRNFAIQYNMTYAELISQLEDIESGATTYISVSDMDAHGSVPIEVWDNYEKLKGREVSETLIARTGFSCSC